MKINCFDSGQALAEDYARIEGYDTFYSWSRLRQGYSGVAIFCKTSLTPIRAEEGLINRILFLIFYSFN
jgi:AP endonuclease-2